MADDGPLRNWGIEVTGGKPEDFRLAPTAVEQKIGKGVIPAANIPTPAADLVESPINPGRPAGDSELDRALGVIRAHIERGHAFTNGQMDVGAKLLMTKLSKEECGWVMEIAQKIHHRPLWHLWVGWFKFCQENAMAQAPIFESNWNTETEADPNMSTCPECQGSFSPVRFGQVYCSRKCGAAADKRKIEEILAKRPEGNPQAVV